MQPKIDKLIDWYKEFKPGAGQKIHTTLTAPELSEFASIQADGSYRYRGRELIPTGVKNVRK